MIKYINPISGQELFPVKDGLQDKEGNLFPLEKGVYRLVSSENYTANFGFQWNTFKKAQIDKFSGNNQSRKRFFGVTHWNNNDLTGQNILEVGSGAGRFSQVVLDYTKANLYSLDYSNAVDANYENNGHNERLKIFQASVYEMPFANNSFDKVFCFGVLQHTPDFKKSVQCIIEKAKPGGEVVIDFYCIHGWWTKINAKYILRPFLKHKSNEYLLDLITKNIDWMIWLHLFFAKLGLNKILGRFVPIADIQQFPKDIDTLQMRELAILDTFDMFSPTYDNPQRLKTVGIWFEELGMVNVEARLIKVDGNTIAVVKGYKELEYKRSYN